MKIGNLVATRGISEKVAKDEKFAKFVAESFGRYMRQDWGDTCKEDWKLNDDAVKYGNDRIVVSYDNIFIITEYDRSYTMILFKEEY